MEKNNRRIDYTIDRIYRMKYGRYPFFEDYDYLMMQGMTHSEAFVIVQNRMETLWDEYKKYRKEQDKKEKEREQTEYEFYSCPIENTPFCFTATDMDILNHVYQVMQESPVIVCEEYGMITGE